MFKKRLFGMITLIVGVMLAFVVIGCGDTGDPSSPPGGNGTGDGSIDGLAYTATETRSIGGGLEVNLYLLSDDYDTALAFLNTKFDSQGKSSVLGNSNLSTTLASSAPDGAVLYVIEPGSSTKISKYLAKKESGNWNDSCVEWEFK
jgi:hypothetical protein